MNQEINSAFNLIELTNLGKGSQFESINGSFKKEIIELEFSAVYELTVEEKDSS